MDLSELERTGAAIRTDWEEALQVYENVIACGNEALQIRAIIKLARLSDHAPEDILARTIPILVDLLGSPGNLSVSIQEAIVYCFKCIACQGQGKLAVIIGQSSAVPSLLRLLVQSDGSLQRVLLKCLRNIVTFGNLNRIILVQNGGLEIILNMLNSCPDGSRCLLLEILSALALLREVRRVIVSLGGLCFIVESARCGSMISRTRAAQAIGLLGLVRRVRRMLVDLGVIPVLIELLRDGDSSTKVVAGNALGVISSHVDYIRPVADAGAIDFYVELLQGPEPMGKDIAEDVFCILAVAKANAVAITEHMVRVLRGEDDQAKGAAADILWDLSGYQHSLSIIRNSGVISTLVELLRNGNEDVRERVAGAVSLLSSNEEDRITLVDAGAIPILIDMLHTESEELKDNITEALMNFSENPLMRDSIISILSFPLFQDMQDRLIRIRASDARLAMSLREISAEQFTSGSDSDFD